MTPLLRICDISKAYSDGPGEITVFKRASLTIEAGAQIAVHGERCSGKSTLMRIAAGIDHPDAGTVHFGVRDLAGLSTFEQARLLRSQIAYLAVSDWRPNAGESVAGHLAVSLGGDGLTVHEAERRALRELDRVGISAGQAHAPAMRLSMLDRARVMLARALAHNPALIVIDEPVLTPSAYERDRLYELMHTLARERNISLLVASGEFTALSGFDTLMSISGGELLTSEGSSNVVTLNPRLGPVLDTGS
jgi:putative ABC transport system ATP-binding protein